MGAAAAELARDAGAEVVIADVAPITLAGVEAVHVDLAERASIEAAVDACGGRVDALFSCAGVADGTEGIERVDFIGHRHLIDRLLERNMLASGRGHRVHLVCRRARLGGQPAGVAELLATPDFDSGVEWITAHRQADYYHSKQAVCAYVAAQAFPLGQRGIRINAICPGPTRTPLAEADAETWLGFGADYRGELGTEPPRRSSRPTPWSSSVAMPPSAINGTILITDSGYMSSGITGSFPPATAIAGMLLGR